MHPEDTGRGDLLDMRGYKALCIATNHGVLDIGVATGVFGSELTVPYYVFLDAGMQVDVASPLGGVIPVDPLSMKELIRTPDDDRLLGDALPRQARALAGDRRHRFHRLRHRLLRRRLGRGVRPRPVRAARRKVSEAYAAGRVVGGICHGPLGLLRARTPDGELLVKGRRLTAVTDKQIHEVGVEITPLHPETALRQAGARFEGTPIRRATSSRTTLSRTATSSPDRTRTPGRWWRA